MSSHIAISFSKQPSSASTLTNLKFSSYLPTTKYSNMSINRQAPLVVVTVVSSSYTFEIRGRHRGHSTHSPHSCCRHRSFRESAPIRIEQSERHRSCSCQAPSRREPSGAGSPRSRGPHERQANDEGRNGSQAPSRLGAEGGHLRAPSTSRSHRSQHSRVEGPKDPDGELSIRPRSNHHPIDTSSLPEVESRVSSTSKRHRSRHSEIEVLKQPEIEHGGRSRGSRHSVSINSSISRRGKLPDEVEEPLRSIRGSERRPEPRDDHSHPPGGQDRDGEGGSHGADRRSHVRSSGSHRSARAPRKLICN